LIAYLGLVRGTLKQRKACPTSIAKPPAALSARKLIV
jgi:hypothetical protein